MRATGCTGILRSSLGFARDFACGFPPQYAKTARPGGPGRRPQCGSTSTPPHALRSLGVAQDDKVLKIHLSSRDTAAKIATNLQVRHTMAQGARSLRRCEWLRTLTWTRP